MNDFSTNSHSVSDLKSTSDKRELASLALGPPAEPPQRHPFSFNDGNLAVKPAGEFFFTIHEGLLSRHSSVFQQLVRAMDATSAERLGGCPVLYLPDPAEDWLNVFKAFYDGYFLTSDVEDFPAVAGLLVLCTKYKIQRLREMLMATLAESWPKTLSGWEARELKATDHGIYAPRLRIPHPIMVIDLARQTHAPELLPSAMYDLSRTHPSISTSYTDPSRGVIHSLSNEDLLSLLRGREHASRFLSTFIVNDLESRAASAHCTNQADEIKKRICVIAYEAVTFELLRDSLGAFCNRNADPLYAIAEAELMQEKGGNVGLHACEPCRTQFARVVESARQEFWAKIPAWFNVKDLLDWE